MKKLHRSGTHVVGVGINLSNADKKELTDVATEPKAQNVFNVESAEKLDTIADKILNQLCDGKTEEIL